MSAPGQKRTVWHATKIAFSQITQIDFAPGASPDLARTAKTTTIHTGVFQANGSTRQTRCAANSLKYLVKAQSSDLS
jgi:hypothetical protein